MFKYHTPAHRAAPVANYSHGVEVAPGARWLFASGQIAIDPDDNVPPDLAGQARVCFENVAGVLAEAGMSFADVVRLNTFVSSREGLADYMAIRDEYVASPPPASTLLVVAGFAKPEFKIEIEVIAAKA